MKKLTIRWRYKSQTRIWEGKLSSGTILEMDSGDPLPERILAEIIASAD
jgi:hypothetical protein